MLNMQPIVLIHRIEEIECLIKTKKNGESTSTKEFEVLHLLFFGHYEFDLQLKC